MIKRNNIIKLLFIAAGLTLLLCCKREKNPQEPVDEITLPIDERILKITTLAQLPSTLKETSGIVISNSSSFWSHEDAGNSNELYLVNTSGTILKTLTISNVKNNDWEDLAKDNQGRVYINDAGNNSNDRKNLAIYRIPNPDNIQGNSVQAEIISFSFEDQMEFPPPKKDQNFNIEGIIWKDNSIFLFTKDGSSPFTGITKMYKIPDSPGNHTALLKGSFFIGNSTSDSKVTSAAINAQTGELVLLTRNRIFSFTNYANNDFFKGKVVEYKFDKSIGQVEAIDFVDNNTLYITNEENETHSGLHSVKLPIR